MGKSEIQRPGRVMAAHYRAAIKAAQQETSNSSNSQRKAPLLREPVRPAFSPAASPLAASRPGRPLRGGPQGPAWTAGLSERQPAAEGRTDRPAQGNFAPMRNPRSLP